MKKVFTVQAPDENIARIADQQLFELVTIEGMCAHDAAVEVEKRAWKEAQIWIIVTVNQEVA